jgi:ATP-dependent DNA helicase RecG
MTPEEIAELLERLTALETEVDLTNASLRKAFRNHDENYSMVSRVIGETVSADLIKPSDPDSTSRRHASYAPFWA